MNYKYIKDAAADVTQKTQKKSTTTVTLPLPMTLAFVLQDNCRYPVENNESSLVSRVLLVTYKVIGGHSISSIRAVAPVVRMAIV